MSALRLGILPDGTRDVRVIDDGANGRVRTRYAVAGALVQPALIVRVKGERRDVITPRRQEQIRAAQARYRERQATRLPRCGVNLPLVGEPCARFAGHAFDHRSKAALASAAWRRGRDRMRQ